MTRDPLGLFPEQPAQQPRSDSGGMGWAVVGVLLGVALLLGYQRFGGDFSFGDGDRDHQEQRDDTRPAESKGYLIFVHERKPLSTTEADMLDTADAYCAKHPGLEWRSIDDDDTSPAAEKIKSFAASKGITPPLVVFKTLNNVLRSAAKFPTSESELKAVIR